MTGRPAHDDQGPGVLARRTLRVIGVLIACYVALIATHGGEFWPFSSYPMFAAAGRPWQRAVVRVADPALLGTGMQAVYPLEHLPGKPLALARYGIPQNDLSSLVQRLETWRSADVEALSDLFGELPCAAPLVVMSVRGSSDAGDVRTVATALAALTCENGRVEVRPFRPPEETR